MCSYIIFQFGLEANRAEGQRSQINVENWDRSLHYENCLSSWTWQFYQGKVA